jgi:hydrogenase maturation protein HypF
LPEAKRLRIPGGTDADTVRAVRAMLARGSGAATVSSCGRLFDAVSALLGLAPAANEYEGEAAMRLEAESSAGRAVRRYPFVITPGPGLRRIGFGPLIRAVAFDREKGVPRPDIAASFHAALARAVVAAALIARQEGGLETAVLCGGVFLNRVLLERATAGLEKAGFRVLRPVRFSPNDESISVGQAAFALASLSPSTG